jgi:hypothetical protein
VEQAEAAMSVYDAIAAARAAQAASGIAQLIGAAAARHGALRTAITNEREAGPAVSRQGYRLEVSGAALDESDQALAAAADALQSSGAEAAGARYDEAQASLERAIAQGSGAPALREENEQRLAVLEKRGQAAAERITEGRRAFDLVDEFAESTWSDIRGNGSEAQAAADRAQQHWEQARAGNTMEAQQFYEARQNLDATVEELDFVEQLVVAILTRLKDLEAARDSARGLLAEAERSILAGQEFVRTNDPDVSKAPEQQLRSASEQLAVAQAEAARPKPDWLKLAAAATAADKFADEALAGARTEAEAMQKLRQQAERLRPIVAGEVNKIAKYVNLHGADIKPESMGAVKGLVQRYEKAQTLDRRAAELEEERRRAALEQLIGALTALQQESDTVYQAAYADVQRLEQLRGQVNQELANARNAIERVESLAAQVGGRTPRRIRQRLQQLRVQFDQIRLPINGEDQLTSALSLAQSLEREARELERELFSQNRPGGPGGGPVVIVSGGWGGSGSWTGGGGGGSSGPSWGSMGSSGGSFGGGSSGGSFGGGSSGGGW